MLCPTCKSTGFPLSKIPMRCTFCDGTEGGDPPSEDEIAMAKRAFDKTVNFILRYGMRITR